MKGLPPEDLTRRRFLGVAGATAAAARVCPVHGAPALPPPHEASFYEKLEDKKVKCGLCPRRCVTEPGKRGHCGVRENRDGTYYSLVYGRPVSIHNDPIEKKPFFHVLPGTKALSLATVGCNIHCKFCQNHEISQASPDDVKPPFVRPDRIAHVAVQAGSKTVAYTYSEPTVFYEYMYDCARAAKERGVGNVVVSNGFIREEPVKKLLPLLTAYKVDFKAFSQNFYAKQCEGRMKPVQETLKRLADSGIWFEIVVLTIPTLNDDLDEIKRMAAWVLKELGPNVPLHFTRFHPAYKLRNLPRTPMKTVIAARKTAMKEGCRFVYTGNMPGGEGESTYCPKCGHCVLKRYGHFVLSKALQAGKCAKCGEAIPGVWP